MPEPPHFFFFFSLAKYGRAPTPSGGNACSFGHNPQLVINLRVVAPRLILDAIKIVHVRFDSGGEAGLHFIHLLVFFVLGQLEVRIVGGGPEFVARHHEEDQSGYLHQELRKGG